MSAETIQETRPPIHAAIERLAGIDNDSLGYAAQAATMCELLLRRHDETVLYPTLAEAGFLFGDQELFEASWPHIKNPLEKWDVGATVAEAGYDWVSTENLNPWRETTAASKQEDVDPVMRPAIFLHKLRLELIAPDNGTVGRIPSAINDFDREATAASTDTTREAVDALRLRATTVLLDHGMAKAARNLGGTIEDQGLREQFIGDYRNRFGWQKTIATVLESMGIRTLSDMADETMVSTITADLMQQFSPEGVFDIPEGDDPDSAMLKTPEWRAYAVALLHSDDPERARNFYFKGMFCSARNHPLEDVRLALHFALHDRDHVEGTPQRPEDLAMLPYGNKRMLLGLDFADADPKVAANMHEELLTSLIILWHMNLAKGLPLDAYTARFEQHGITLSDAKKHIFVQFMRHSTD